MIKISITKTDGSVGTGITYLPTLHKPELHIDEGVTHDELEQGIFNVIEQLKKEAYDKGFQEAAEAIKTIDIDTSSLSYKTNIALAICLTAGGGWVLIELIRYLIGLLL